MFKVLAYRDTHNLGDAIQTVALCRWLGSVCVGIFRDEPHPPDDGAIPFVVNGWLGGGIPAKGTNSLFAGIHIGHAEERQLQWIRNSPYPAGARDPYTHDLLVGSRIANSMTACATLTFERFSGMREGRYAVDVPPLEGVTPLTNRIGSLSWEEQWELALHRLEQLR